MAALSCQPMDMSRDAERIARVMQHAFLADPEGSARWLQRAGPENVRVVREGDALLGTVVHVPMGQFFGGRSVPMTGIAGVAVAPEGRGRGVATTAMRESLREIRRSGVPISTLFPATQPVYRRVGYEQAGHRFEYRLPIGRIDVGDRGGAWRELRPEDEPLVRACYADIARTNDGNLDRGPYVWSRVLEGREKPPSAFIIEDPPGTAAAYVVVQQVRRGELSARHDVVVGDMGARDATGWKRVLGMLSDFESMGVDVVLFAGQAHPALFLLGEQRYSMAFREAWMVRLVDVAGAIAARGYAPGVSAEVHLDIADDLLAENAGRHVLRVADGRGRLEPGGRGEVALDIGALASVYSGFGEPTLLRAVGRLKGPDAALGQLRAAFAGPAPWMPDQF